MPFVLLLFFFCVVSTSKPRWENAKKPNWFVVWSTCHGRLRQATRSSINSKLSSAPRKDGVCAKECPLQRKPTHMHNTPPSDVFTPCRMSLTLLGRSKRDRFGHCRICKPEIPLPTTPRHARRCARDTALHDKRYKRVWINLYGSAFCARKGSSFIKNHTAPYRVLHLHIDAVALELMALGLRGLTSVSIEVSWALPRPRWMATVGISMRNEHRKLGSSPFAMQRREVLKKVEKNFHHKIIPPTTPAEVPEKGRANTLTRTCSSPDQTARVCVCVCGWCVMRTSHWNGGLLELLL